jgi:phosphonate metabolism-associated iron-containing alcohol dehydrogenase
VSNWTYYNPVRVVSAVGSSARLVDYIGYQRIALVTSPGFSRRGVVDRLRASLGERLIAVLDDVKPNPDVLDVDAQAAVLRRLGPDCIAALGGGSSIDTAKGLARLLGQSAGTTLAAHFREGTAFDEARAALPVIAIPTTAGTGAEVTPFGTIWDFGLGKKYSVTGADLYPAVAVLDPELTLDLPEEVTISSGLDAISHALESTWNRNASPITLGFATKSLQLSLPALQRLRRSLHDLEARTAMMQASLLSGLAISQTRTALAHSISYPLTTHFNLPHGIACSFTLPALMRFNATADDGRLRDLAHALGHAAIDGLADSVAGLIAELGVAELFRKYIPDADAVQHLVGEMFTPGRADNNLRGATQDDVSRIVSDSLQGM